MADARTGRPEVKAVAAGNVTQEAVGFNIVAVGDLKILAYARLSRHEVVGNESSGQSDAFFAGGEELQNGHRTADVVRAGTVWTKFDIVLAALEFGEAFRMVEVYEKQLFGECQRTTELGAHGGELLGIVGVESLDHVEVADLGRILCGRRGFLSHQEARSRNRGSSHCAGSACLEQLTAGNLQFRHQFFSCFSVSQAIVGVVPTLANDVLSGRCLAVLFVSVAIFRPRRCYVVLIYVKGFRS